MHDFLSRLGMSLPIIQAPMAGSDTAAMVAQVGDAGGLGSIGAGYLQAQALLDRVRQVRDATSKPFAINLFVLPEAFEVDQAAVDFACRQLDHLMEGEGLDVRCEYPARWAPSFRDQFAALCEARPRVASFAFGLISPEQMRELRQRDILVVGTATNADEAMAWEALGADAIGLQGSEAGGHRGGFLHGDAGSMIGLMALIPQVMRAVTIPVIAAGGIMNGRQIHAALGLGAVACQMGTAFLACEESAAAPGWKRDLTVSREQEVVTIHSISGRAARGLNNTWVKALEPVADRLPPYPILNALTSPLRKAAVAAGRADLTNEWSGQGVGMARAVSVARLMADLARELDEARRA
ncbi:nitronate monooxygenase [Dyella terrae]|uniref:Nitronate monooxygenase n=3 Tax=Rhodanobacteraceae TaxID=1775411 RepID=A0A4R0YT99_9GAMM|nr:nitronate monooxygenase [Dyella terrae]TCI12442.1 nitronate monooxygenase [Dyella soli]